MLPGRRDLNRCFRPPFDADAEGAVAGEALRLLREAGCEALVDLHNNTGHNPAYGVGTCVDAGQLNLTGHFATRFVASDLRLGALTEATAADFPSVAIECGRAGDPATDAIAVRGLRQYLTAAHLETRRVTVESMTVLNAPLRVSVRPEVTLAFASEPVASVDLTLLGDLDRHNFQPLLPGVPVGWLGADGGWPIEARGADGEEVSHDYFVARDGLLVTRRGLVPIMMTTDAVAARADCLFYVVHQREEIGGRAADAVGMGEARGER
jgi:hypothetical protein